MNVFLLQSLVIVVINVVGFEGPDCVVAAAASTIRLVLEARVANVLFSLLLLALLDKPGDILSPTCIV